MDIIIVSLLTFIIGYLIGYGKRPTETIEEIKKNIRRGNVRSGPVNRPSAETVSLWANPQREAEEEEFKKSFTLQTGLKP